MSDVVGRLHEAKIEEYLRSRFQNLPEPLPADYPLDRHIDSLGLFDVVEWVENAFDLKIPNEEFSPRRFASMAAILDTVERFRRRR